MQRSDRNLNATSQTQDTGDISSPGVTTPDAEASAESRELSGRSLARLDLPLGEVFGPNVIQCMASNNASSTILLDGGKLSASYDPKYKIVRANFGDRSPTGLGPVNVELDESGQNVKRIWGMPPPTKTDLQYLANSGFLCAQLLQVIKGAPEAHVQTVFSTSSMSVVGPGARVQSVSKTGGITVAAKFASVADIIHPDALSTLMQNRDYVLLTHRPKTALASIHTEGLRSLRDLAEDEGASSNVRARFDNHINQEFGNDPDLIYFRPVGKKYSVLKDNVVIAVKPEAVFVYDSECRARTDGSGAARYEGSEMSISSYFARESDSHFMYVSDYSPEVCVRANKIGPEFFVKYNNSLPE